MISVIKTTASLMASLLFFGISYTLAGNDIKVTDSKISLVRIYTRGALVTREANVDIETGVTQLTFENLPSSIDKQSITLTASGDMVILSVNYELSYLKEEQKTKEQKKMEDSLEWVNGELDKMSNLNSVYTEEQSMILSNKTIKGDNVVLTADNIQEVADFYRVRLTELKSRMLEISNEIKKLRKEQTRFTNQLSELKATHNKPTSVIKVSVSSTTRMKSNLVLSYFIRSAGWSPIYDIRAKDISSPIQLNCKAEVYQNSGEDWTDVHIKLSTGNPNLSGSRPNLNTWYLNYAFQPYVYNVNGVSNTRTITEVTAAEQKAPMDNLSQLDQEITLEEKEKNSKDGDNDGVAKGEFSKNQQSTANYITASKNQLVTDFDIALPYSVPSDGKVYSIDVQNSNLKADYYYLAVPKKDRDAFLQARVSGWESLNLLSGTAHVYFENSFVGNTYLNMEITTDTLEISLGRDKRIVVERENVKEISGSQFLGNNRVRTMAYEITVRNTKQDSIKIVIEDQIPISNDKDIDVKVIDKSDAEYNDKTGKLIWKFPIAPAETKKKKFSFSVKYNKNQTVSGL